MAALVEMRDIVKRFGTIVALDGVSFSLEAGEVHCLLGDNGAGKSTLIRILSGFHLPTSGEIWIEGERKRFASPSDALDIGIATVYQDLGLIPLMSVTRNFFMGREPIIDLGVLKLLKKREAARTAHEEMMKIGIDIQDPKSIGGNDVRWAEAITGDCTGRLFWCESSDPRRANLGPRGCPDLDGVALHRPSAQTRYRHHFHQPQCSARASRG